MNIVLKWFLSLVVVAFGQPAWGLFFGPIASVCGYAIFWSTLLKIQNKKRKFGIGFFWFLVVQMIQLCWMTTTDYMGSYILFVYGFLVIGCASQFAIICCFLSENLGFRKVFALSGLWVLFEWSRLFFLCGFTWNPVGLSMCELTLSSQLASVFGVYGLSFWVVFVNLILLCNKRVLWAFVAAFPYLYGFFQKELISHKIQDEPLIIAIVHTELLPEQKDFISSLSDKHIMAIDQWDHILSQINPKEAFDLIIMPEVCVPWGAYGAAYDLEQVEFMFIKHFSKVELPEVNKPLAIHSWGKWRVCNAFIAQALANLTQAELLMGLERSEKKLKHNCAFHIVPNSSEMRTYDKRILAPVGEYIPLSNVKWVKDFIGKKFGIYSSFDSGINVNVFESKNNKFGVNICLEETFSEPAREMRKLGADFLVCISNDSWFPNSMLAKQHFEHARIRAIENGMPLFRSCNMGISTAINCFGESIPILKSQGNSSYYKIKMQSFNTLFTNVGDQAIVILSIIFVFIEACFSLRVLARFSTFNEA